MLLSLLSLFGFQVKRYLVNDILFFDIYMKNYEEFLFYVMF